jgi:hypothetical protein
MVEPELKVILEQYRDSDDRLAFAIGKFVMEFASMEGAINRGIGELLHVSELDCQLIVGPILNVNLRLDILQSLASGKEMPSAIRGLLNSAIQRARNLNDDRNWIVHDEWAAYMDTSDQWQKIKPETKAKFRMKAKFYSPAEIMVRTKECAKVERDVAEASTAYARRRDGLPPLR